MRKIFFLGILLTIALGFLLPAIPVQAKGIEGDGGSPPSAPAPPPPPPGDAGDPGDTGDTPDDGSGTGDGSGSSGTESRSFIEMLINIGIDSMSMKNAFFRTGTAFFIEMARDSSGSMMQTADEVFKNLLGIPTLEAARSSLWSKMVGLSLVLATTFFVGNILLAYVERGVGSVTGYATFKDAIASSLLSVLLIPASYFLLHQFLRLSTALAEVIFEVGIGDVIGGMTFQNFDFGQMTIGVVYHSLSKWAPVGTPFDNPDIVSIFGALFFIILGLYVIVSAFLAIFAREVALILIFALAPLILAISMLPPLQWLRGLWLKLVTVTFLILPINMLLIVISFNIVWWANSAFGAKTGPMSTFYLTGVVIGVISVFVAINSMYGKMFYGAAIDASQKALKSTGALVGMALTAGGAIAGFGAAGAAGAGAAGATGGIGGAGGAAGGAALAGEAGGAAAGSAAHGASAGAAGTASAASGTARAGLGSALKRAFQSGGMDRAMAFSNLPGFSQFGKGGMMGHSLGEGSITANAEKQGGLLGGASLGDGQISAGLASAAQSANAKLGAVSGGGVQAANANFVRQQVPQGQAMLKAELGAMKASGVSLGQHMNANGYYDPSSPNPQVNNMSNAFSNFSQNRIAQYAGRAAGGMGGGVTPDQALSAAGFSGPAFTPPTFDPMSPGVTSRDLNVGQNILMGPGGIQPSADMGAYQQELQYAAQTASLYRLGGNASTMMKDYDAMASRGSRPTADEFLNYAQRRFSDGTM